MLTKRETQCSEELCRTILVPATITTSARARELCITRTLLNKYYANGYVPLCAVRAMANQLEVTVWHLAYGKLEEVFGDKRPDLERLVNTSRLSAKDRQYLHTVLKNGL